MKSATSKGLFESENMNHSLIAQFLQNLISSNIYVLSGVQSALLVVDFCN